MTQDDLDLLILECKGRIVPIIEHYQDFIKEMTGSDENIVDIDGEVGILVVSLLGEYDGSVS